MQALTFYDTTDLVNTKTYHWAPEEVINQAIDWINNYLLPEDFPDEISYYRQILKSLTNSNKTLQLRLDDAVDVLESVNIYQKDK